MTFLRRLSLPSILLAAVVVLAPAARAQSGPGGSGLLLDQNAATNILTELKDDMQAQKDRAEAALIALMAIHMAVAGIALMLFDRPMWGAFTYPIVAAVLMAGYEPMVKNIVEVPQIVGWQLADDAIGEVLDGQKSAAQEWGKGGGLVELMFISIWELVIKGFMIVSLLFSVGAFALLELFQVATIGILWVVGPYFVLAAAFRGTAQFTIRWVTLVVEASSWTLVWGVLMTAAVAIQNKVPPLPQDPMDPTTFVVTVQRIALGFLFGLLTLSTPIISRSLIGGGLGGALAAATMYMANRAYNAAGGSGSKESGSGSGGSQADGGSSGGGSASTDAMRDGGSPGGGSSGGGGDSGSAGSVAASYDEQYAEAAAASGGGMGPGLDVAEDEKEAA